jgi:hypothetical protein
MSSRDACMGYKREKFCPYWVSDPGSFIPQSGTILTSSLVKGVSPPIKWVPGALSRGLSGRDVKLTTHLQLVPRSRNVDLYIHSPICLHGVMLN